MPRPSPLVALLASTLAAAPAAADPPASAPAADSPAARDSVGYINESFETYEALRQLDELVERHDWPAALRVARDVRERFGDLVVRTAPDRALSVRWRLNQQIARWPADALAAYLRAAEPEARRRRDALGPRPSISDLADFAEDFFPTAAAADAVELAIRLALESSDLAFVRQWTARLRTLHPLASQRADLWSALAALAAVEPVKIEAAPGEFDLAGLPLARADLARAARQLHDLPADAPRAPAGALLMGDARRIGRLPSDARAEAMLWRCDRLGPTSLVDPDAFQPPTDADQSSAYVRLLSSGRLQAFQPAQANGLVIVHDHLSVWALDPARAGALAWRFRLAIRGDQPKSFLGEDDPPPLFTTTVDGDRLYVHLDRRPADQYAAAPDVQSGSTLVCLAAATGRLLWQNDFSSLRGEFDEVRIDSAPIVVRDRLALVARRRKAFGFEACLLLLLDRDDGRLRFVTHVGEAATGGYGYRRPTACIPAADGDLVFVNSNLGSIAAVHASSGSVAWLDLYRVAQTDAGATLWPARLGRNPRPWHYQPPIVWRDRVLVAPFDSDSLLVLDQATGETVADIPMARLKNPATLAGRIGDRLYAVGDSVLCFDLRARAIAWERPLAAGELFGRAALCDAGLFVPTTVALLRYPLDAGLPDLFRWDVDTAGNPLPLPERRAPVAAEPDSPEQSLFPPQIVVASNSGVAGLMRRDHAFAQLDAAMRAAPADPFAALALASLALRTHDFARGHAALLAAIDRAGGIARLADPRLRRLLFDTLLQFADAALAEAPSQPADPSDPAVALLELAGQLAVETADQVLYRLRLAAAFRHRGRFADSAATWQQLLADASLRSAPVRPDMLAPDDVVGDDADPLVAGLVARRAIDQLILQHGAAVYDAVDRDAQARFDAADAAADPDALLAIADAFPNSRLVVTALRRRAALLDRAGQLFAAAASLKRALAAVSPAARPPIYRELIDCLVRAGDRAALAEWLDRAARDCPDLRTDPGDESFAHLRDRLRPVNAHQPRRPALAGPLKLAYEHHWEDPPVILTPRFADPADADVANVYLFAAGAVDARRARDDHPCWNNPFPCRHQPVLLSATSQRALLATRHQIFALDPATGTPRWQLGEHPAELDAPDADPELVAAWIEFALSENTLFAARDRGDLVAIDLASGQPRWKTTCDPPVTGPSSAGRNVLAAAIRRNRRAEILFFRAATGEPLPAFVPPEDHAILALTFTAADQLLILAARELSLVDPLTARLRWRTPTTSRFVAASLQLSPDAALLATEDGRILAIRLDDGRLAWATPRLPVPAEANLWTALADGVVTVAADHLLSAYDTLDGRPLWTLGAAEFPGATFDLQPPMQLADGLLMLSTRTGDGPVPGRQLTAVRIVPRPDHSDAPTPETDRLGRHARFRGAFAYDDALVVIDGRRTCAYVAQPTSQPVGPPAPAPSAAPPAASSDQPDPAAP